jgi:dihydroxy-acid dehydratase
MVLKHCGPNGYPGMAEVGNMPLPAKVLRKGITDMVRISDARMSGTAFGTVVLHTAPEAAVGGPLALVRNGDFIELDVEARRIHLDVPEEELVRRRAAWVPPPAPPDARGGYSGLYVQHVMQADTGADFDFLGGSVSGRRRPCWPRRWWHSRARDPVVAIACAGNASTVVKCCGRVCAPRSRWRRR